MPTFYGGNAHVVNRVFSLYSVFLYSNYFHLFSSNAEFGSDCASSWALLTFYVTHDTTVPIPRVFEAQYKITGVTAHNISLMKLYCL